MLTVTVVLVDGTSVDARARSEDEDGESGELGVHHAEWSSGGQGEVGWIGFGEEARGESV